MFLVDKQDFVEDVRKEISSAVKEKQKSLEQKIEELKAKEEIENTTETRADNNEFFSLSVEYHPGVWQEEQPNVYFNTLETESTNNPYYNNLKQESFVIEEPIQEQISDEIKETKLLAGTGLTHNFNYKTAAQEEILKVQRIVNFTLNTVLYDIL